MSGKESRHASCWLTNSPGFFALHGRMCFLAKSLPQNRAAMEMNGAPHSVGTGQNEIPPQKPDQWTCRCVHLVRTPCDFCCIVVSFSGAK